MAEVEIWKPVIGYEGSYQVSNMGRVRSLDRPIRCFRSFRLRLGKLLTPRKNQNGYLYVTISEDGKNYYPRINRLVAVAFLPPPKNKRLDVHHKDHNRTNNKVSNLEWASRQQNIQAMYKIVHLRKNLLVSIVENMAEIYKTAAINDNDNIAKKDRLMGGR